MYRKAEILDRSTLPFDVWRVWRGFWQLADPKIWTASTVPMLVGTVVAYAHAGRIDLNILMLTMTAIYLLEIGKNAINEWADFNSGVDAAVTPDKRTPFSGGKKTLVDGILTEREVVAIAWTTTAAGAGIGLALGVLYSPVILAIGAAGIFAAIAYSLPPFALAYRGLGEPTVGFTFGPLLTLGAYAVQTGAYAAEPFLLGIPLGLLIANVLWINQFPDYEADRAGGKRNGVVRLGRRRAVVVYAALYALAYLAIVLLGARLGHYFLFLALFSLPLCLRSVGIARRHYDDIPALTAANAQTIGVYLITGILLALGLILSQLSAL